MKKHGNELTSVILSAALIFFVIAVIMWRPFTPNDPADKANDFNTGWFIKDGDGECREFDAFNQSISTPQLTLYHEMVSPSDTVCLGFYNSNCAVSLYVDDELIYDYSSLSELKRGVMPGNNFAYTPLTQGSEIKIVYESLDSVIIHGFHVGSAQELARIPQVQCLATVIGVISTLVAMIILFAMIMLSRERKKIHQIYFPLNISILLITAWGLTNTQLLEMFNIPIGFITILFLELFMVMLIPFLVFMSKSCMRFVNGDIVMIILLCVNFIAQNALHFTGIAFLSQLRPISYLCNIASLFTVLMQVIVENKTQKSISSRSLLIGFIALMLFSAFQLIYNNTRFIGNSTFYLQIGISFFVASQVFYISHNLFVLAEDGYRAEAYLKLAKTDPLTGINNRMAMVMAMDNLAEEKEGKIRFGCIICDLNNLKRANDTFGHSAGDELISGLAHCLDECFAGRGTAYRTGGDEFHVLFPDTDIDMPTMLLKMDEAIENYNKAASYPISCARGSAIGYVDSSDTGAMYRIIQTADKEMYEQKREYHRIMQDRN